MRLMTNRSIRAGLGLLTLMGSRGSGRRPRRRAAIGPSESGHRLWLRRLDQLDATPIAKNGTVAYTTGGTQATRRAAWVNREGLVTPVDSTWDPQGIIGSVERRGPGPAGAVDPHPIR